MLVLTRRADESIVLHPKSDAEIWIKVLRVVGDVVEIGVLAPVEVEVHGAEAAGKSNGKDKG